MCKNDEFEIKFLLEEIARIDSQMKMMDKKDEKSLPFFVLRSKYRKGVLFKIIEKPYQTQAKLLKETSPKYRSHLSRTIKELLEQDLIECENPNERMYKIYSPTDKALKVKEEIEKYEKTS